MNYDQYVKYQTEGPGMIRKPLRYRLGERRAIDWFFATVPTYCKVLDLGCGTGVGLQCLKADGFEYLEGIELNPKKAEICRRHGLNVTHGDIERVAITSRYDVIWASHSFEHMLNPENVIQILTDILVPYGCLFVILPYPDTGPKEVHCASDIIGTRINDGGKTVMKWFEDHGLEILDYRFDNFRENEIWLEMIKSN